MRDHVTWRPVWYRSEYHDFEEYDREQRRHARAGILGGLTAVVCAVALIYLFG